MKKFLALALMLMIVCSLFAVLPTSAATKETELNLDWQFGQLYNEDEPVPHQRRKYAVISDLKEGDVITVVSSNWGAWVYPADGGKALGSDIYYEIKPGEPFIYTVKPEGSKVPTQLRLCIFNVGKDIIDDAIWSTFDMKITLTTEEEAPPAPTFEGTVVDNLTWTNGTYYSTAPGNGNGKYIYTVIELKKGDKIQFEIPGVWNLWVYPAVNGVADAKIYRGGNGDKKIANGEIMTFADDVTELRVTAYIEGGAPATVESDAFKTLDLKFHKISAEPEVKPPHTADGVALASMIGALAALAVVTGVVVLRNKRVFAGK